MIQDSIPEGWRAGNPEMEDFSPVFQISVASVPHFYNEARVLIHPLRGWMNVYNIPRAARRPICIESFQGSSHMFT